MAWRTVKISNPANLRYKNKGLLIIQKGEEVSVPLEDIGIIVLENMQISLTGQLLSRCAAEGIAIVSVGETYHPNGIFIPFLSHSRALQVMKLQLAMTEPRKKRFWQRIVRQKLFNQAAVLYQNQYNDAGKRLSSLGVGVRSGDSENCEAAGAQLYFRTLWGRGFYRDHECFTNAALNYGYSIIRSAIARSLVAYGFQPAFGLHHHNEQNAFNLADDLIEPYRSIVDLEVLSFSTEIREDRELTSEYKNRLIALLHSDILMADGGQVKGFSAMLSAIDMTVQSLGRYLRGAEECWLPVIDEA